MDKISFGISKFTIEGNTAIAFASDLLFAVGYYPKCIIMETDKGSFEFILQDVSDDVAVYSWKNERFLKIFNT